MNELSEFINEEDPEQIFQLLDMLGQGSYGSVHKALLKQTGELYAVKILPATSTSEIDTIKKEIAILKDCNDDHIVRYFGSYFKDSNLWIVMEYCIAGSITDIMQITKRKLSQEQIASILESALKGLDYIHSRKKIHRDIKAANILLDQKGNAKLADFGVSASSMQTNARFKTHIGSPYWMSPQIIKYSQYDYKTDIWSLGITAIELAEGQVPNSHIKPYMALFAIRTNPVQSLTQPKLWSQDFNDFVKKCLQLNPANRPEAKQLLHHSFIKNFSKGQKLLSELVLSSMQEIQQFRMNQSRNTSFAEIILNQNRQPSEYANTVIENSQTNTVKRNQSQPQESQETDQNQEELMSSMIILDSHRSTHSYSNSVVQKDLNDKKNKRQDTLDMYINKMKSQQNQQINYIKKLVAKIENYDLQFMNQVQKLFRQFKEKVSTDVKMLEQLRGIEKNSITYTSKLHSCDNAKEYFYAQEQLIRSSSSPYSQESSPLASEHGNENRKQTKSFIIPKADVMQNWPPFKKSSPQVFTENSPSITATVPPRNNSSRMMVKPNDQLQQLDSDSLKDKVDKLKLLDDPQFVDYIKKSAQADKSLTSSIAPHTKSSFQPNNTMTYTGSKVSTQVYLREQRSTQQSISKSKNKSIKTTKSKKMKTRTNT